MNANPYESDKLLAEYLFFHYSTEADYAVVPSIPATAIGFARRVVTELLTPGASATRALDLGCAVGRSAFELARTVPEVVGVDFSSAFIGACRDLQAHGHICTETVIEGRRTEEFTAIVPPEIDRSRVTFCTGDACALDAAMGPFDVVVAANLLCRLPDPAAFLERLPSLINPGGQLLLATPFSWLPEFTPEEKWIGGREDGPSSLEELTRLLAPHFTLETQIDLPFLIREHSRKYQLGISLGTRWRRH
jgi:putative 4-mercaptohistidine N1-methyltranferase